MSRFQEIVQKYIGKNCSSIVQEYIDNPHQCWWKNKYYNHIIENMNEQYPFKKGCFVCKKFKYILPFIPKKSTAQIDYINGWSNNVGKRRRNLPTVEIEMCNICRRKLRKEMGFDAIAPMD